MTRHRWLIVGHVALAAVTAAAYLVVLLVTSFLACGISGCGGGGFGPSFSPVETQVGMLVCGAVLLPLTLVVLRSQPVPYRVVAGAAVVVAGALLAMTVLDLGPHGCPASQTRAVVGGSGVQAGEATCSADDDAVPARSG